jgi:hypothetical protein
MLYYLVAQECDTYLLLTISRLLLGGLSSQCHFADPQYAAKRLSCNALITGDHRLGHSIALIRPGPAKPRESINQKQP